MPRDFFEQKPETITYLIANCGFWLTHFPNTGDGANVDTHTTLEVIGILLALE